MLTLQTRKQLASWLPKRGVGVEVGVENGNFAETLRQVTQPRLLWLIDCWEHQTGPYAADTSNVDQERQDTRYVRVQQRFARHPYVRIMRGYSVPCSEMFENDSLDWVYIDADHTYDAVLRDLYAWWYKVKPCGILCGHDYVDSPEYPWIETKRAVDEFCAAMKLELDLVTNEKLPSWAIVK